MEQFKEMPQKTVTLITTVDLPDRPHDANTLCYNVPEAAVLCDYSRLAFNARAHPAHYARVYTREGL